MMAKPAPRPKKAPSGRAAKAERLLSFARELEAARMSYDDIMARHKVSRSTAFRMIDDLKYLFPSAVHEHQDQDEQKSYFSLSFGTTTAFLDFDADEFRALHAAVKTFAGNGRNAEAACIRALAQKLVSQLPPKKVNAVTTDGEALVSHEGLARTPGPRPAIDGKLVDKLRYALLAQREIEIDYAPRIGAQPAKRYRLQPHGLLFGNRNYLVAFTKRAPDHATPALFALSRIRALEVTARSFTFRAGFDIDAFANESFGVWHGDTIDVVWRFAASRAGDVMEMNFHPTQKKTVLPDGSVEVRFRASGQEEMLHHLFTWKDALLAIEPAALRDAYAAWLRETLAAVERMTP